MLRQQHSKVLCSSVSRIAETVSLNCSRGQRSLMHLRLLWRSIRSKQPRSRLSWCKVSIKNCFDCIVEAMKLLQITCDIKQRLVSHWQ